MRTKFTSKIIDWYLQNKRDLPWRKTKDPYVIWLSEILLQQTRVEQGLPYFNKFLKAYPDLKSFVAATEDEILKMWQGLGYYSRARNMMSCAKIIIEQYDGKFPDCYSELVKQKGIGRYTAAAIASFCFNEPVSVIDGNVYRVLSRVFGIENDLSSSKSYQAFYNKAQDLIDIRRPDLFNQSMMEFGALHCTPRNPSCESCIFSESCIANLHNMQALLPIKTRKTKRRNRYFNYIIISFENKILIKKRSKGDVWNGLYEFLLLEKDNEEAFKLLDSAELQNRNFKVFSSSKEYKHILSHQTIFARFYRANLTSYEDFKVIKNDYSMLEIDSDELNKYPISILIDNFLKNDYF